MKFIVFSYNKFGTVGMAFLSCVGMKTSAKHLRMELANVINNKQFGG
jgi:hypothetical protein